MEFRQLEHFLAVVDSRNFTSAAARVHVVQSTLSASVRSLETSLGVRLFDRSTHRVEVTDAGRVLEPEARRVLAAADTARDAVAAVTGGTRGTLRIGIMHSSPGVDLAGLLGRFHAQRPLVSIEPPTHPNGSAGLVADVAAGRLDIAIAAVPGTYRSDVEITQLFQEPIRLARPPGHPPVTAGDVRLTDVSGEAFIDVPPGWGSRDSVDRLFAEHGLSRTIAVEVPDVATVLQLVQAGLGHALIAPSSAPLEQRAHLIPMHPPPTFTVSMVTPKERVLSAATRAFLELVTPAVSADA